MTLTMKLTRIFILSVLFIYGCDSPKVMMEKPSMEEKQDDFLPQDLGPSDTGEATKVGLLLPLSGSSSTLGKQLLNSAQLALFSFSDHQVELLPRDTKGEPSLALDQTKKLLDEGAQLILGPLFAVEVDALRAPALAQMVPVVSLTNNVDKAGQGVFVFGFSPDMSTNGILDFARKKGYRNFAALLPSGPFGKRLSEVLLKFTQSNDLPAPTILYAEPDSRSWEFELEKLKTKKVQVLFVPEGGVKVIEIATYMKETGLSHIRLLGSGQWDDPVVLHSPVMENAWYPTITKGQREWFNKKYEETYGEKPQRLSSLAFDMVALAIVLSKDAKGQKPFTYQTLVRPQGFRGVEGLFKITPSGTTQRELSIFQINLDGVKEIGVVKD